MMSSRKRFLMAGAGRAQSRIEKNIREGIVGFGTKLIAFPAFLLSL